MDEKKKELIPVAAIAVFLVIIIILCVIRLNERRQEEKEELTQPAESVEMIYGSTEAETRSTQEETDTWETKETQSETETIPETQTDAAVPDSQETADHTGMPVSGNTINGRPPFAGAETVKKTNQEMLAEMAAYWEKNDMAAIEDLSALAWYRRMSASIADKNTFYYYGDRNAEGRPEGKGIAVYADNEYYYGDWVDGKRQGSGQWFKKYVYYDSDTTSDRAYKSHMYIGEWADDMPNGEGQEHFELDMKQAASRERYVQNVIGTFLNGYYNGEMFLTTIDFKGNPEEWNGLAEEGIWSPYGSGSSTREIPVCVDVGDEHNYMWMPVRENKDQGIRELVK